MNAPDRTAAEELFKQYAKLRPEQQDEFLHILGSHLLIHLPDGKYLMLTKEEFQKINLQAELYKNVRHALEPFMI